MGAEAFGGVLCPLLASEVRPMFQAWAQAREGRRIKHREEDTLCQACSFDLIADRIHETRCCDIACYHLDFKCVIGCYIWVYRLPIKVEVMVLGNCVQEHG